MKTKQLQLADNSLLTFVEWCADNGYTEDTQQSSHFYSACDKQGNVAEWREDTDGTIKSFVVTYGSTEDDVEQLVQDLEHTEHLHQELKRKDTELLRRAALLFMEQYHTNVVHFKEVEDGGDDRPVYGWSRSPVTEIEFDDNGDMCNFKFLGCNGEETWFNDVEDHALLQDELENHFDIADLIIMQLRSGEPLQ